MFNAVPTVLVYSHSHSYVGVEIRVYADYVVVVLRARYHFFLLIYTYSTRVFTYKQQVARNQLTRR